MMNRRGTVMVIVSTALVAGMLAGCKDKPEATGTPPPAGSTAATTAPAPAKKDLPVGGKCVLLTVDQATTLLGATPKSSGTGLRGDEIVHVDGCTYIGAASNLGYDVNDYSKAGITPAFIVQQAKTALGQNSQAQAFAAAGGDDSAAFTMPVGAKTMARIELAKGKYIIAVNATDAVPAKAKQIALDALAILVAAVG